MKTKRRLVCTIFTLRPTELCPTRPPGQDLGRKPRSRTARAWCVAESIPDKPEKTHKRRWGGEGRAPQEKGFRTKEPPRPVGPKDASGTEQGRSADRPAQGHGKGDVQKLKTFVPSSPLPSVSHSVCLFWMNVFPPGTVPVRGGSTEPVLGLQSAETLSSLLTPTYMCISDGWVLFFFVFFFVSILYFIKSGPH